MNKNKYFDTDKLNKRIKDLHNLKYVMSVDNYDKDVSVYCLSKVYNNQVEILLCKKARPSNEFHEEVINLSKYFNAEICKYE